MIFLVHEKSDGNVPGQAALLGGSFLRYRSELWDPCILWLHCHLGVLFPAARSGRGGGEWDMGKAVENGSLLHFMARPEKKCPWLSSTFHQPEVSYEVPPGCKLS